MARYFYYAYTIKKKYVETTVTTGEGEEAVTETIKEWENVNDIYIGSVTVASHVIAKVEQPKIGIFGNINNANSVQPATVIETYKNGTSWYRVWSDGWCEQGGLIAKPASTTNITVNLLKSYANTDWEYSDSMQMYAGIGESWSIQHTASAITSKTTSSFTRAIGYGASYSWQACGYIAEGV